MYCGSCGAYFESTGHSCAVDATSKKEPVVLKKFGMEIHVLPDQTAKILERLAALEKRVNEDHHVCIDWFAERLDALEQQAKERVTLEEARPADMATIRAELKREPAGYDYIVFGGDLYKKDPPPAQSVTYTDAEINAIRDNKAPPALPERPKRPTSDVEVGSYMWHLERYADALEAESKAQAKHVAHLLTLIDFASGKQREYLAQVDPLRAEVARLSDELAIAKSICAQLQTDLAQRPTRETAINALMRVGLWTTPDTEQTVADLRTRCGKLLDEEIDRERASTEPA